MAQINIGSIKFKWQGAYAGGTAYTVDDVVSYNGSSYICILASTGNLPTNATYWEQMSSAGTNGTDGTDLTSTLTTQGDILYRDGSGLQKLGAGTSGQVLQTGGTGANPSWVDASSGKIGQVLQTVLQGEQSITPSIHTWGAFSNVKIDITPTATSSKIWVGFNGLYGHDNWSGLRLYKSVGGGSYNEVTSAHGTASSARQSGLPFHGYSYNDTNTGRSFNISYLDSPNTTSQVSYQLYGISYSGSTQYIGRSYADGNQASITRASTFINAWEILA